MAAAIIPIVTTVLPLVAPLVVKLVEKIFGGGTGAVKKPVAVDLMTAIMDALQKLVGPSVSLPTKPEIPALVQSVVDALNKAGELQGGATVISPAPAPNTSALDGVAEMLSGALKVLQASRRVT
jgi:hypothetical protein